MPKYGEVGTVDTVESQQTGPEAVAPCLGPDDTNVPKLKAERANRGGDPSGSDVPTTRERLCHD